ncbi:FAD-dependent oxidoreductase [bacterium]|nr:FAD-dependent oxidoreductase [candidate division CSSED10-310 bacterium]
MNDTNRITEHPVLSIEPGPTVTFYWNRQPIQARRGEMIASALIANGIHVFSRHPRDGSAQGIFCANGQCAKCMVIANGIPVKSCMTPVRENMFVECADGLPKLPDIPYNEPLRDIPLVSTDVLVIGGGPAGLSAALELGRLGIRCLIIDDKHSLGGKLVLQTHKFFGSVEDSHAGTRGIEIGELLAQQVKNDPQLDVWLESTVLFVFKDRKVGVLKQGAYILVHPRLILNAAGAREKFLRFHGNTLPGVYGAGAFQTLVNRDLVRASRRLFIVGGGNVGLIAGYHALQAGIDVVGLAEALPACGGYKVHADKLRRLGVPIFTRHTVLSANGCERVESVTIAEVDDHFSPITGTEKSFACDTLLIAVGLESIDEFTQEAHIAGVPVFSAGDAQEIAEASSAMFNGRIVGLQMAAALGKYNESIPDAWFTKADILKAHPGRTVIQRFPEGEDGVMPVIHCIQEIPCNPCSTICPTRSIHLDGDPIMGIPEYQGQCTGCGMCVAICPGLAITLVDYRSDPEYPNVTMAYEISNHRIREDDSVLGVDIDGGVLGEFKVTAIRRHRKTHTYLVALRVPREVAKRVVSFRIQDSDVTRPMEKPVIPVGKDDDIMVCLCERVTAGDVRALIKKGVHDINMIKAITRAGMGPCGSKNCDAMIRQIFRQEGVPISDIVAGTRRPLFVEVPLGTFAGHSPLGDEAGSGSGDGRGPGAGGEIPDVSGGTVHE